MPDKNPPSRRQETLKTEPQSVEKQRRLIDALKPKLICFTPRLEKVNSVNWGIINIDVKMLPPLRLSSGDSDSSSIYLPDIQVESGFYKVTSPVDWVRELMTTDVVIYKCRMFDIKATIVTQSGRVTVDTTELLNESIPIDSAIITSASSSENLIARCQWGNYLVYGIFNAQVEFKTKSWTITGSAPNMFVSCLEYWGDD